MKPSKNITWVKLADSIEQIPFNENGLAEIEVKGKKICLANHHNNLMACTSKCPHAGGALSQGYLDALGNIVCPIHRYKFNMLTGRNVSGEGYYLKIFSIEIREDAVFIGLEENKMFNWLK
ncbi:MAG: Rieske 2Fe-2S domain-containing protein [Bacteroidetes bacterium]|nr:Rieske 2Fe-2S domain-containing protein [Bacteroidota bacterium]MBS1756227.1 Rieske 2Fe-2S domain-containing protein [Bacteroidota bacterium]